MKRAQIVPLHVRPLRGGSDGERLARLERRGSFGGGRGPSRIGWGSEGRHACVAVSCETSWPTASPAGEVLGHVETHPLRAGDALQVAAAIVAAEERPESIEFVTFDRRQAEAAEREGFRVLGVS